jgi:monoamine oxidase
VSGGGEGDPFDVAVLGAGASGLSAASRLSAHGLRVVVIEARDRVGGRVHTLHDPLFPLPVELGAEFIHSRTSETFRILQSAGTAAYLVDGDHWQHKRGKLRKLDDFWGRVGTVLDRLESLGKEDVSFAEFLDRCCRDRKFAAARELALSFIEGFDASHADRISAQSVRQAEAGSDETEGSESFRILGGYGKVVEHLRQTPAPQKLTLHLRTIVTRVRWKRGSIELDAMTPQGQPRATIRARRCIVTLPVGVLRAGSVKFEPDLPDKWQALAKIEVGPVVKAILKFREPFWETQPFPAAPPKARLTQLCFLHGQRELGFPTWWTYFPVRAAVLTAWAGGPAAERLSHRPRHEILAAALDSLAALTGLRRAHLDELLDAAHVADWQSDPFARGAYSYLAVGGIDAPKRLGQSVGDTLFFAGEATATEGLGGTVDAALTPGRRAAEEVLEAIG